MTERKTEAPEDRTGTERLVPFHWIPVEDRLPPIGVKVLIYGDPPYLSNHPECRRVALDERTKYGDWNTDWKVTHWFPVPEAPED